MIRTLLVLAIIAAPVVASSFLVGHHDLGDDLNVFQKLFVHVMPAQLEWHHEPLAIALPGFLSAFTLDDHGVATGRLPIYNLQLFQIAAVLLMLVGFSGVAGCIRSGRGDYVSRLFAGFVLWIRDEMVVPIMGKKEGARFLPFFLTIFFFIIFMNLLGLVPGGATATASIGVTAAMASITFLSMLVCGMVVQGPLKFWVSLVPHGLPLPLVPLLFVVELIGLVVKPVALTIRLFANMTAGHLIVLSGMGLIFFFAQTSPAVGGAVAPLAIGFAVFIMVVETFVACLQAYIFTYLSILFVQMSTHPDH